MLIRKAVLALEIEDNEGVAETIVAADGILVENISFTPGVEMHERDPIRANLSPWSSQPGKRQASVSFDVALVGTTSGGVAPHWGKALRACGFSEDIDVGERVEYKPASDSIPSVTIGWWLDGKKYLTWGARGTVTLKLENGIPGMLSFEFTGADWSEDDEAILADVPYECTIPPVFMSANLTIDDYAAILSAIEINMNNEVALRQDVNAPSGHLSAQITARKPSMTLDPENVVKATFDFFGKWRSAEEMAFDCAIGDAPGNIIRITAPRVQIQESALEDRDGISTLSITAQLNGVCPAGGDELVITIEDDYGFSTTSTTTTTTSTT
jgi:hypothetical protein